MSEAVKLNADQSKAESEILSAYMDRGGVVGLLGYSDWLIKGYAGAGKTFFITRSVVPKLIAEGARVVVTAPTHKAVQVLRRKLDEAGLQSVTSMTIHALIGLKPTTTESEKQVLKRANSEPKTAFFDVVIIDETSMIGADLQDFIDNDLSHHFVIYIGDPAQLPPVGEPIAPIFARMPAERTSTLNTIMRQGDGNPILDAATAIREQQGKPVNWNWVKESTVGKTGVYLAGEDADEWMKDAFTSQAFADDNDAFRYVCYTNARVHEVNAKVRKWIYGETETPFVPGERVICRNPILDQRGNVGFSTNEEAIVVSIERDVKKLRFEELQPDIRKRKEWVKGWEYDLPVWKVQLKSVPIVRHGVEIDDEEAGTVISCYMPIDREEMAKIDRKLVTEAKANSSRWFGRFQFIESMADLRPVYALTSHSSQGSTFKTVFVDIPDISKRQRSDAVEMQKLLYVAVTRASDIVVIVG